MAWLGWLFLLSYLGEDNDVHVYMAEKEPRSAQVAAHSGEPAKVRRLDWDRLSRKPSRHYALRKPPSQWYASPFLCS